MTHFQQMTVILTMATYSYNIIKQFAITHKNKMSYCVARTLSFYFLDTSVKNQPTVL